MTATQITAALRACAAGFYAEEAGTEAGDESAVGAEGHRDDRAE